MSRCRSEPTEVIPELSKNGYRNLLQKSQLTGELDAELKLPIFVFSVPPKPYLNRIGDYIVVGISDKSVFLRLLL